MKSLPSNLITLFYPSRCVNCLVLLLQQEQFLCVSCLHELPIIEQINLNDGEIINSFFGRVAIENATSFLYYRKDGITQKLIHDLKYNGNQEIGTYLGKWFGDILYQNSVFNNIDFIIPVPLHKMKLKKRGFNQLTTFGNALSDKLSVPYVDDVLIRISSEKTQTFKKRFERFRHNNTKFKLVNNQLLEGKHILLIDDVITTGATLESCCNELLKTKNILISIATIAYTQKD